MGGRVKATLLTPLLLAVNLLSSTLLSADGPARPLPDVQKALESAMKSRTDRLLEERNENGAAFKRGSYSRTFKPLDDATYQGTLHVDTALGSDLRTERLLVTLKKDAGGAWSIASEEVQEIYEGLHRSLLGDEECVRFASFAHAADGFSVKAGAGTLCKDHYQGKVSRFWLSGADLSYDYTPPSEKDKAMLGILKKERSSDIAFPADHVMGLCDPATCEAILAASLRDSEPAAAGAVEPAVKAALQKAKSEMDKELGDNPFAGFRRPYEAGRKHYALEVRRKGGGDHWLRLTHDSNDGREISLTAKGFFGAIQSYYSDETRARNLPPDELERRPDADGRDYDMTSLEGTVEMGFEGYGLDGELMVGDIAYDLTVLRELREIPFGIARIFQTEEKKQTKNPRMFINSIQDGEGNELTWVKTGAYEGLVILPAPVSAGTSVKLRLQFENKDSIYKLTPSYSYVDRGGWLPFVRFSDMIHRFDLTVKVPAKYKTLGIGRKASETTEGGASITRWVADSPVTFPTVIFGDYYTVSSKFKAKRKDGTEIPVLLHFDRNTMGEYGIAPKSLNKFADDAANAINLYREVFGVDYPYSKLDLVNDPVGEFYGQAPSSLIYLGSASFFGKGVTAGLAEGGTNISKFVDSLVAHEVAHQWWGSCVANANFRNYWFVESLAEYSSALFMENVYGKKAYQEHVDSWRTEILGEDMRGSVQDGYTVWGGPGGFGSYRAALYAKGPYAFHIMRQTWGEEKFFPFLKSLAQDLAGKEIVTRDIQRVAEKSFGANLDWFFDQWLRGVGLPQFTFSYTVRAAEDGTQVIEGFVTQSVELKQARKDGKEVLPFAPFKGIVPITVIGKSGKEYRKRVIIEGEKTAFKFNVPEKPREVVFNKYGEVLGYDVVVKAGS